MKVQELTLSDVMSEIKLLREQVLSLTNALEQSRTNGPPFGPSGHGHGSGGGPGTGGDGPSDQTKGSGNPRNSARELAKERFFRMLNAHHEETKKLKGAHARRRQMSLTGGKTKNSCIYASLPGQVNDSGTDNPPLLPGRSQSVIVVRSSSGTGPVSAGQQLSDLSSIATRDISSRSGAPVAPRNSASSHQSILNRAVSTNSHLPPLRHPNFGSATGTGSHGSEVSPRPPVSSDHTNRRSSWRAALSRALPNLGRVHSYEV